MITIFSTPKPFRGHFAIIQRNAIRSWTLLRPACEIILFGDEAGAGDVAREFGLRHIPDVARYDNGPPLISDMFEKAQNAGAHNALCYVNCDIILMNDFAEAVQTVAQHKRRFLMVGRRWGLNVTDELRFEQGWQERLKFEVERNRSIESPAGIDYFAFSRGLWGKIPPFAVGRPGWDNWMIYRARCLRAPVIDATPAVTAIHQSHDYSHHPQGTDGVWKGKEAKRNLSLMEGKGFTTEDSTHVVTANNVRFAWDREHLWRHMGTLPGLYPSLRLPIFFLSEFLRLSRPVRSMLGMTLNNSTTRSIPD